MSAYPSYYYSNPSRHGSYEQGMAYRNTQLNRFGAMYLNGELIHKIDHIASVTVSGGKTFNVYRRYNSVYCIIIIEDTSFNYLIQRDMSIRQSIASALCLQEWEEYSIKCIHASSVKHNMLIPDPNLVVQRWSDIQDNYTGVTMLLAYKPDEYQSQVNEVIQENFINQVINNNNNEYVAPLQNPIEQEQGQGQGQGQQDTSQQTPSFREAKKRRRSELELLEPLPYNLRNKKQKI